MVKRDSIQVPPAFPNILKTYAKEMIRTQPHDILAWSAAYFRCVASNVHPPVKLRFEGESSDGHLTKEYLKTLVSQIGKGYFVDRYLLQTRWKGLGLPENELFVILAASGTLEWDILHWLKLVALMSASISESFQSSVDLMCEMLSEDPEGGSSSVPLWMFNVGYTYLASFDGSMVLQGSRPPAEKCTVWPERLSSKHFRDALVAEWRQFSAEHSNSNISSNLKFGNAYDGFKQSTEFHNLIALLKDIEIFKTCAALSDDADDDGTKIDYSAVMHELGAPWSWMYDFVEHNSPATKSYNFIEFDEESAQPVPLPTPANSDYFNIDEDRDGSTHSGSMHERESIRVDVNVPAMPGVGKPIVQAVIHDFLNHLRYRSIDENGMVFPRHFRESECPKMTEN